MNYQIFKFLKNYSTEPIIVDRLIISTYLNINKIKVENNNLLRSLLITKENEEEWSSLLEFICLIQKHQTEIGIEDLIQLFEFIISPAEKEINGAVYTPKNIREHIIKYVIKDMGSDGLANKKFADLACGCGGFFYDIALYIHSKTHKTFASIYAENIYGIDIQEYSISRTKILLTLLAVSSGEDLADFTFNLYIGNSLNFNWNNIEAINNNGGFDAIVGNPPYVSSSKIDESSKSLLSEWSVAKTGKPDLYIVFFQIGLENLKENGILGYITVNNFYRSLNGRGIRNYLSQKNHSITIIDFGAEQIFKGRSTYTCLCFIKNDVHGNLQYAKYNSKTIADIGALKLITLAYPNLSNEDGWLLQDKTISDNIRKIESTGTPLGKCFDIRNGFATLLNDVYLFSPLKEENACYYFEKAGQGYWIEKEICRDAIKPNTLRTEGEIEEKIEKLIFPYSTNTTLFNSCGEVKVLNEKQLKEKYPLAYTYLKSYRAALAKRDKNKREYETWFAYGRSQAINIYGHKLLFPYISDTPSFVYSAQKDLLFYNGYAIVSDNEKELLVLQKLLNSKLFWYYIKYTSKPYGSEYYALAKNYVKNFGVYKFDDNQKKILLRTKDQDTIDQLLSDIYGIDF